MYVSHRSDFECVFYNERERVCVCVFEKVREREREREREKAYKKCEKGLQS